MPWKYDGNILKIGKEFTGTDGTQYSKVWMRYSDSEKAAIGITWENPPASEAAFDNRFYWGRDADGELIPRSITDINEVDEDDKPILDIDGNQLVTKGLKTVAIETAKTQAASLLAPYDWYVVRNAEKSTAIPSSITNYRDSVRTACANIETAINAVKTHAKFMALYDVPVDSDGNPTGKAPINAWPDAL